MIDWSRRISTSISGVVIVTVGIFFHASSLRILPCCPGYYQLSPCLSDHGVHAIELIIYI